MTTTDERRQQSAAVHNKLRAIFEDAEQRAHDAVQADDNAQARVADLESVIDRLRRETVMLVRECEQYRLYIDQLKSDLFDQRAANHNYARLLTDVRAALGAEEDADLAEEARSLVAESEGRRKALEQIGAERRAERARLGITETTADEVEGRLIEAGLLEQSDGKDIPA